VIRSLAEKFSRNVVLKRRLPREFEGRKLFVSPDSALRYWRPGLANADRVLLRLAQRLVKPGDIVWDIGANVGLFSFSAAAMSGPHGRVLSIEPDPWLASLLVRSEGQGLEGHAPVTVLPVAVSSDLGLIDLHVSKRGRASNFVSGFGSTQAGGTRFTISVLSVSLDWISEKVPMPNVLKIDVEGMEHLVLRGARRVLERRPIVICEVSASHSREVKSCLSSFDYKILDSQLNPAVEVPFDLVAVPT
jgi:FkbM family methyltransferase